MHLKYRRKVEEIKKQPISSSQQLFIKYPNNFFIETGSHEGAGVNAAIQAGFPIIASIELYDEYYLQCAKRFASYPQVRISYGNSTQILWELIKDFNQPITFWLDAHYSGVGTAKGDRLSPILKNFL